MTTITKSQLLDMAKSNDPATRQRALEIFQAWLKSSPQLDPRDRLNVTESAILIKLFQSKGMLK